MEGQVNEFSRVQTLGARTPLYVWKGRVGPPAPHGQDLKLVQA